MNLNKLRNRLTPMVRNAVVGRYEFFTLNDLVIMTREWVKTFEKNYDLIVGIPRSGLFVANTIGLMLGKPVTTPDRLIKGEPPFYRKGLSHKTDNILLVDDSISSGRTMAKNSNLLAYHNIAHDVGVVFTTTSAIHTDTFYRITGKHRIFEWNMMHTKYYKAGFDMDGVLCENCPETAKDNIEEYKKWIVNAKPYLIPSYKIDVIISNRLELFRTETEDWLERNNVHYDKLVLWDTDWNKRTGLYQKNKKKQIDIYPIDVFFESSLVQAKYIYQTCSIPVICIDSMVMFS